MAFTRAHLYPETDQIISYFAQAISHPARIAILRQLYGSGPTTVENISKMHPLLQPTLSQHLKILRKAQLITCHEKFPYTIYQIDKKNYNKLKRYMQRFANSL